MKLHEVQDLFKEIVEAASHHFGIREVFIEKDYWVTYVLKNLSLSKYADKVVFKGGTSLSKGHKLINRFSDDVDVAVIITPGTTGNQMKSFIRTVEKEISCDLEEIIVESITSKGSRFRKAVYK